MEGRTLLRNKHTETRKSQGTLKEYEVICSGRNTKTERTKTGNKPVSGMMHVEFLLNFKSNKNGPHSLICTQRLWKLLERD